MTRHPGRSAAGFALALYLRLCFAAAAQDLVADCEFVERRAAPAAEALGPRRELIIPRLDTLPELDGGLADAVWQKAAIVDGFTLARAAAIQRAAARSVKGDPSEFLAEEITPGKQAQTLGRVYYTDTHLCLAFECPSPAGARLIVNAAVKNAGQRDASVWQDDDVEIFLSPADDGLSFYQFGVNPAGVLYDGFSRYDPDHRRRSVETQWNCDVRAAVARQDPSWTAEMVIPLAAFGQTSPTGSVWGFNVQRQRTGGVSRNDAWEHQFWSPCEAAAGAEPRRFGALVFGHRPEIEVLAFGMDKVLLGRNRILVRLRNTGAADAAMRCEAEVRPPDGPPQRLAAPIQCAAGRTVEHCLEFEADQPGEWSFSGSLTRGSAILARRSGSALARADLLLFSLSDSICHVRDRYARASLVLNVSPASLGETQINARLIQKGAVLRESLVRPVRSAEAVLFLNLQGLKPGAYDVRMELLRAGRSLAEAVRPIEIEAGPFD